MLNEGIAEMVSVGVGRWRIGEGGVRADSSLMMM
jgi:hypothetical protein